MYRPSTAAQDLCTTRDAVRHATGTLNAREDVMAASQTPALIPSRWESSPTRRARSRSSGSPTPTSPGWSSATSTPRAGCWGGTWSCVSRTARRTTPSRPRRRRSWSSTTRRRRLRRHLQLHEAGHQGPGRRQGQDALHLPGAVRGGGVRSAHLLHRPGAGAADRPVHPVADARDRSEDVLPSRPPTTSGRTC